MEKWLVERSKDQFETHEGTMHVSESGALVFRPSIWDRPTLVLAAGQWITVVRDED